MKLIYLIGVFVISMVSLTSATITINSPNNATVFNYSSLIPIDFTSDYGDIHVFVSHNTSFTDNNIICKYASSGSYICNFSVVSTGAYESVCESLYKFGDDGNAVGDDSGSGNDDCSVLGTVDALDNCGVRKDCAEFTSTGDALSCGTGHSGLISSSDDFTIMAWVYFPTAENVLGTSNQNYLFEKGDQRPSVKVYGSTDEGRQITYTGSGYGVNDFNSQYIYDEWQHLVYQQQAADVSTLFYNDVQSGFGATNPSMSGANEYIGNNHNLGALNWKGYIDEMRICNRLFTTSELNEMYIYKDGIYYFKINNSNGDEEIGWFIKDLTDPIINLIEPTYESHKGYIEFNIDDLTNTTINITLDGVNIGNLNSNETQYYLNETELSLGEHNLTIVATDEGGRITTKEKIFDVLTIQDVKLFNNNKNFVFKFFLNSKDAIIKFFGGSK